MTCILVSVYHPYRWIAPFTWGLIERHWPDHPPAFFCGLSSEEAAGLPHVARRTPEPPASWASFVHDAATALAGRGFTKVYFLLEDHPPLGSCHGVHLNQTLPRLMADQEASYIGLMGWDNRRFTTRAPKNGPFRMMHLTPPRAPRFHLHPSLFRMDVLLACLELVLSQEKQTPWMFEKTCDKEDARLPEAVKRGCYQTCGEDMAVIPAGASRRAASAAERFVFHRAMNLFAPLHKLGLGMRFWDAMGFDDFFYNGPYPMFYSGVMSRARLNPFFLRHARKELADDRLIQDLIVAADKA